MLSKDWYIDFVNDFVDNGYEITVTGGNLKASNKVDFDIVDVNLLLREMIGRIGDEYKILNLKTYFNVATGNSNFELDVCEYLSEYFYVNRGKEKVKILFNSSELRYDNYRIAIMFNGFTENGKKVIFGLFRDFKRVDSSSVYSWNGSSNSRILTDLDFFLNNRGSGISIDHDQLEKAIGLINKKNCKTDFDLYEFDILDLVKTKLLENNQ